MVIDHTYFVQPLVVANLNTPAVIEGLYNAIMEHSPLFLQKALGYNLYAAYMQGIEPGSDMPPIEGRWLALKNGTDVQDSSGDMIGRWPGFDSGQVYPINPVAAYVWFYYQRYIQQFVTAGGAAKQEPENAKMVVPMPRIVQVWNQMAADVHLLWRYLMANRDTYPELRPQQLNMMCFQKMNVFGI